MKHRRPRRCQSACRRRSTAAIILRTAAAYSDAEPPNGSGISPSGSRRSTFAAYCGQRSRISSTCASVIANTAPAAATSAARSIRLWCNETSRPAALPAMTANGEAGDPSTASIPALEASTPSEVAIAAASGDLQVLPVQTKSVEAVASVFRGATHSSRGSRRPADCPLGAADRGAR